MEIGEANKKLLQYLTVSIFSLFSVGALFFFGYSFFYSIVDIIYMKSVIKFDKGAMHMLGVGLSSGLLTFFMVYEILNKNISESFNKKATRLALMSIALIFIFPQIAHYTVSELIPKDRYMICKEMSYQWMMHKKIVYTDNQATCDALIKQEEIRLSQPWF